MPDYLKKSFFINLLIIIIIFSLDRVSKFYVINLIWNEGIAFGLLSFDQKLYYNLLTVVILIITAIILWMVSRSKGMEKIAFLIVLGGSLGNIFDRVLYKSVPDFIDFHINNFHWFIFNVADIFITLGVILLIYLELIVKTKK